MLPEERHVLALLKTVMRLLGVTNRDVERRLGLSGSYLSRLFSGDIDLRFSHLVSISRALGMEPEELLWLAFPPSEAPESEAARRLTARLRGEGEVRPLSPPPALPLRPVVERVVARLLEQLSTALRNPPPPPAL